MTREGEHDKGREEEGRKREKKGKEKGEMGRKEKQRGEKGKNALFAPQTRVCITFMITDVSKRSSLYMN